jgi:hypothetical protein
MLLILSVVLGDVDIVGIALAPTETDLKLIVDSDAVLAGALSRELFQTKARKAKIRERPGRALKFIVSVSGRILVSPALQTLVLHCFHRSLR